MLRCFAFLAISTLAAAAAGDLDVGLDPGRPYDFIKTPSETPTGGGRRKVESGDGGVGVRPAPPTGKPGETVVEGEEKKKKEQPPPAPPNGLPGVSAPSTVDWPTHVAWKPKDEIVDWKDPGKPPAPTPTGPSAGPAPKAGGADVWDMSAYPPKVSHDLYIYCATRFLQVLLHQPQVHASELTQYLIEMDYPGYYAATAVKGDGALKMMSEPILAAVGPMVKTPPKKPEGELRQRVWMDLLLKYPYDADFGAWILSQPSGKTVPVLLEIIQTETHPLLVRNAVFILRCFNNREIVEPLFTLLTTTKDAVVRNRALIALARWGHPGAAKWCAQRLKGGDSFRTLAAWAIGRIALASPVDAETVDKLIAASKEIDQYGEFVLSSALSLGQIGRYADDATKKKIEAALLFLQRACPAVKNPPSQGGTGAGMVANNDPAGIRAKIIDERIRVALALMGRAEDVKWMTDIAGKVHISNTALYNEATKLISSQ
jgi:hypothetical protein